ncbi:MAG: hypothetical protein A2667_02830 [Candidatus Wildermuthbacteria bacterium RIFCSPHIGHO2_01_FULL_47_27]|uniref:Uncharacterized protein n=1 Tax=Candidatus Wildermuthbacteria bacterium RIFCSPHIGHO2_02_FULL_47_17 TaxID=1802452 RepID=A0A1G2R753_9BACT|nr:MAG: hypothetical protein UY15_C0014G0004 [Parcubacteria group bacterium GW2011_GWA2_47_9]OHA65055.1 MAG: hypothetical protein A2667_02830 [Candidatus Wildermuthbacteria bacterium RIFCSPHIGHO2_01_FULL_47_27]OHA68102.1 MAG: hypothetical protein A3D59_00880 [Candidatus Wildermuthbacteria bacterium RIFCSPHIGHO2_02_FULL_47_17]
MAVRIHPHVIQRERERFGPAKRSAIIRRILTGISRGTRLTYEEARKIGLKVYPGPKVWFVRYKKRCYVVAGSLVVTVLSFGNIIALGWPRRIFWRRERK